MGDFGLKRDDIVAMLSKMVGGAEWQVVAFEDSQMFAAALPRYGRPAVERVSVLSASFLAAALYEHAKEHCPDYRIAISVEADDGCWAHADAGDDVIVGGAPGFVALRGNWQVN